MKNILKLKTDDGADVTVICGDDCPTDPEQRRNTIYLGATGTCPCCDCTNFPHRTRVEPELRSAAFTQMGGYKISPQVAAFRYPTRRALDVPKELASLHQGAFPLESGMRIVMGRGMTADLALALWLLILPGCMFARGAFPHPLPKGNKCEELIDALNPQIGKRIEMYKKQFTPSTFEEKCILDRETSAAILPDIFRLISAGFN